MEKETEKPKSIPAVKKELPAKPRTIVDWEGIGAMVEKELAEKGYNRLAYHKIPQFLHGVIARRVISAVVRELDTIVKK